jgi:hypothetical protein
MGGPQNRKQRPVAACLCRARFSPGAAQQPVERFGPGAHDLNRAASVRRPVHCGFIATGLAGWPAVRSNTPHDGVPGRGVAGADRHRDVRRWSA